MRRVLRSYETPILSWPHERILWIAHADPTSLFGRLPAELVRAIAHASRPGAILFPILRYEKTRASVQGHRITHVATRLDSAWGGGTLSFEMAYDVDEACTVKYDLHTMVGLPQPLSLTISPRVCAFLEKIDGENAAYARANLVEAMHVPCVRVPCVSVANDPHVNVKITSETRISQLVYDNERCIERSASLNALHKGARVRVIVRLSNMWHQRHHYGVSLVASHICVDSRRDLVETFSLRA